ncbi:hypothetical protein chiPu_0022974, partial [Chiloscyllium punctatum]|nr:hypothetical protein [Chiloscyllium punctatum]
STRNLLNIFIRSVFCVEAHEISALSFLWVITCGNGIERITNICGGAQERKFEAGAQAVSETLLERIGKERIRLGTPVLRVEHGAEHVRVISEDGQSFE